VDGGDLPDQFLADRGVLVRETVALDDDGVPGDLGVGGLEGRGDVAGGLADDLGGALDAAEEHEVGEEVGVGAAAGEEFDLAGGGEHVPETGGVVGVEAGRGGWGWIRRHR